MRWKDRRKSSHVEDRRGSSMGGKTLVGGGISGVLILLVFTFLSGGDFGDFLNSALLDTGTNTTTAPYQETETEAERADFVSVVLADTEDVWTDIFQDYGYVYKDPTLVLFSGSVQSACGVAGSSTGPFYCPGDANLYIDLSFYDELSQQFNAPGDFAMAYVVAHEVGHHVQTQLGLTKQLDSLRNQLSETEFNQYQVRFELQADYLAGVWAHYAQGLGYLEEGDYEEAINAAGAVGDDRLQQQAQGYVVPESFTHGTSDQRMYWFDRGFKSGNLEDGDTFNGEAKFKLP
ncbi:KPN_02809 family neutral zinc metallopeptidase [Carnobacterium mobile]|uniref:KPN_02809 family neutral zinc metallopeptidase n=1 Tax=Carnobacterium mobile TaxID=2750 RepID=UPI0018666667|nr:neutral zinc metallopeptidase [Carnobacterium mobile]